MASRYEDRRYPRGWDRNEDEGWGNINRRSGRRYGGDRSNFGGREEDLGRGGHDRGGYSSSGQNYEDRGRYQSGGSSQGSWTGQSRDDYSERGGYQGGGYGPEGRNRDDYSDDMSGGGMFGGGMGGYSGGGYQGYTGGMSNYGGANYGGGRENYGRDLDRGDRYRSDYPSTERGYMTDRERRGGDDRGWFERASDEVSSWFGDDEAERRRDRDARQTGQHRGRGPKNYTRSDDRIREDINDRLTDHYNLDASDIDVEVNAGEVVLTGTVDSRNAKRLAEDIAEDVSGVRNVENRIRVNQGNYGQTGNWGSTASATDPGASAGTTGGLAGSANDTASTTGTTTGATGGPTGTSGRSRGKGA